jgi:hypothetical protein
MWKRKRLSKSMLNIIGSVVTIVLLGIIGYATVKHQKEIKAIKRDIEELDLGLGCLYEDVRKLEKKQKNAGGKKKSQP